MGRVIRSAHAGAAPLVASVREAQATSDADLLTLQRNELAIKEAELAQYRETLRTEALAAAAQAQLIAAERGYSEGMARAENGMRATLEREAARVGALMEAMRKEQQRWTEGSEDALIEVAFTAVCKILGSQATDRTAMRHLINQAARDVARRDGVRVRLHPDDHLAFANGHAVDSIDGLVILADPAVVMGGCLIESLSGSLDARLETQLGELMKVLSTARASRRYTEGSA